MSMKYIRDYYKVPAKRGGRVIFRGHAGTITGSSGQYLRVRLDLAYVAGRRAIRLHPTWEIEYVGVLWPKATT